MRWALKNHEEILAALPKLEIDGPVDSVAVQDEVKLFRLHATVTIFDGDVYNFSGAECVFESPLPVYNQNEKKIGFASAEMVQGPPSRLVADLTIDYATEERLLIETGEKLYVYPIADVDFVDVGALDFQVPLRVATVKVRGLQLLRRKPKDVRIDQALVRL